MTTTLSPTTFAPSVWVRGLIAAGSAAVINTVVFLIAGAAGANMIVAMAGTRMVANHRAGAGCHAVSLALGGVVDLARHDTATRCATRFAHDPHQEELTKDLREG